MIKRVNSASRRRENESRARVALAMENLAAEEKGGNLYRACINSRYRPRFLRGSTQSRWRTCLIRQKILSLRRF